MSKDTAERVRKAQNKALESLDYILETILGPDFVEIVGCSDGDTVTFRMYDDGSSYKSRRYFVKRLDYGREEQHGGKIK